MSPRHVRPLLIALFLGLLAPDAAHSANSQWHAGSGLYPDASCPWVLGDTATPEAPALSGGVLTLSTSAASEDLYYEQTGSSLSMPGTLTISARLRVVSEAHLPGNARRGVAINFAVAPDQANFLWIGQDEVFLWSAYGVQGPTALVDTDDAFHTYEITVVNQSTVTVHQDGAQILTGSIIGTGGIITAPVIWWGDGTSSSSATSEWVFFRHNANTSECGTPSLSINGVTVTEGNSGTVNATFTVSLSGPTDQPVTVNYVTANGTATAGSDYAAGSGSLTIPAKALSTTVTVVVNADLLDELHETFVVTLSGPVNATIAAAQAVGIILDDDSGFGWLGLAWDDVPPIGDVNRVHQCNTNNGAHHLVGVFKPPTPVRLIGMTAEIDLTSDGIMPRWWQFGPGQCHSGSLTANFDFSLGPYGASDPYGGTASGTVSYTLVGAYRACIRVHCDLPNSVLLDPDTEYCAFEVLVRNLKSLGIDACTGCFTPVCLTLRSIQLHDDGTFGDVEIFDPGLRNFATWQVGGPSSCPTQPFGTVSISDASVAEGSSGTSAMAFTITRNNSGCEEIRRTVAYAIVPASATPGEDYVPASGTVAFEADINSVNLNVMVTGDATTEPNETFLVQLDNPRGLSIADAEGVGTILNDDGTTAVPPGAALSGPLVSPNPFRGGVEISFAMASGGLVRMEVYDLGGRRVRASPGGYLPAGSQTLAWDGRGDDGSAQPSGVYTLRVSAPGIEFARRVVRLR